MLRWFDQQQGTSMTSSQVSQRKRRIREVLREHARLNVDVDSIEDGADLYQAGMTSHASVSLMLALEDAFDVEFPDSMLTRNVFQSVAAIDSALDRIQMGAS
jgi:acyl carrier protein